MRVEHVIQSVPGAIFWKDLSGKFLGCNEAFLKSTYLSMGELIGKKDNELPWANRWQEYREDDQQVIKSFEKLSRIEKILLPTQEIYSKTIKAPLFKNDCVIGVLGVIDDVTEIMIAKEKAEAACCRHENLVDLHSLLDEVKKDRYYLSGKYQGTYLTKREAQCLICLARGLTNKETGRLLNISFRTVELFLQNIKLKFSCYTKSSLITAGIESGLLTGLSLLKK